MPLQTQIARVHTTSTSRSDDIIRLRPSGSAYPRYTQPRMICSGHGGSGMETETEPLDHLQGSEMRSNHPKERRYSARSTRWCYLVHGPLPSPQGRASGVVRGNRPEQPGDAETGPNLVRREIGRRPVCRGMSPLGQPVTSSACRWGATVPKETVVVICL